MNGIIGMSELALATTMSREQREYVQTVNNSAKALLEILNDVLDFSKIEAGRVDFEVVPFDIHEVIGGVVRTSAARVTEKGFELIAEIEPAVPARVKGDPTRIRQVVANLVGNAIKFTHEGQVVVRVKVLEDKETTALIFFEIEDSGIGIEDNKQTEIFNPFSQADTSTTRKYGGTGLGLTISQRLVESMGGKLEVRSEMGRGSSFFFSIWLPIAERVDAGLPKLTQKIRDVSALVYDLHPLSRHVLVDAVQAAGLVERTAYSLPALQDAMNLAAAHDRKFAVVVDIHRNHHELEELKDVLDQDVRFQRVRPVVICAIDQLKACQEVNIPGLVPVVLPYSLSELCTAIHRSQLTPEEEQALSEAQSVVVEEPKFIKQLKILVAEDNPVNQKLIKKLLEKAGHSPTLVGNGQEAIEQVEASGHFADGGGDEEYDLIFMDIQMPVMGGIEAVKRIREREHQAGRRIPIVALTAHAMTGHREEYLSAGMDDYLTKPIDTKKLIEFLRGFQ
jgi:CheY-like chemotaxis protein